MNTAFNILWFEDEVSWFNMEKLRIESILKSHYLIPNIVRRDGDGFQIEELTGNDFDLILMDYKLAEGVTGEAIVEAIRNSNILTDILFYSSEEQKMLEAIQKNMPLVDGVYLTKRDYTVFTNKAEKLMGKIVKRSEDVVNLRGFVLDNTSDFELRIKTFLGICWQKFNDEQKRELTNTLETVLKNKLNHVATAVENFYKEDCPFEWANNHERLLSVADRLDIFEKVLPILIDIYGFSDNTFKSNFKDYYIKKVGAYRNRLGHITFGQKTINIFGEKVAIDENLHRLLRQNIAEVNLAIERIEQFVSESI